jgi:hypothetical protein
LILNTTVTLIIIYHSYNNTRLFQPLLHYDISSVDQCD